MVSDLHRFPPRDRSKPAASVGTFIKTRHDDVCRAWAAAILSAYHGRDRRMIGGGVYALSEVARYTGIVPAT
jgi:hypothetical protein